MDANGKLRANLWDSDLDTQTRERYEFAHEQEESIVVKAQQGGWVIVDSWTDAVYYDPRNGLPFTDAAVAEARRLEVIAELTWERYPNDPVGSPTTTESILDKFEQSHVQCGTCKEWFNSEHAIDGLYDGSGTDRFECFECIAVREREEECDELDDDYDAFADGHSYAQCIME